MWPGYRLQNGSGFQDDKDWHRLSAYHLMELLSDVMSDQADAKVTVTLEFGVVGE